MAGLGVVVHEEAEGHVVVGGVLHAGEHALLAKLDEQAARQLGVHAHGDVVGEQRQLGHGLVDEAEVALDLRQAAERVERAGGHDRGRAELLRLLGVLDHTVGLGVDAADEHGHAAVDNLHDGLDDLAAAGVGAERDLAGGAEREQAIDASVDHAVERAREADLVDFAVGGERGDDRGDDPAELCCHDGGSFTKSSYSDNGRPLPSAPLKEANGGMAKR